MLRLVFVMLSASRFLTDGGEALKLCYITYSLKGGLFAFPGNPVFLQRVFHSIRFKVNKVGVRRYSFFYAFPVDFAHSIFSGSCVCFSVWPYGNFRPAVLELLFGRIVSSGFVVVCTDAAVGCAAAVDGRSFFPRKRKFSPA